MKDMESPGNSAMVLRWSGGCLDFSRGCLIMGVLNVTPDSFSDGGLYLDEDAAVAHGLAMVEQGAAIVDVGAESTRPGAQALASEEEIRRAVPVIKRLSEQTRVPISIDTRKPEVARAALDAGAAMVNDVTALEQDAMASLVAEREVPVCLMHMQGRPATMQAAPHYQDVVAEVIGFLLKRVEKAVHFGIPRDHLLLDPGIGFGKTLEHNILLLRHIDRFARLGYRCLVGASRKHMIGQLTGKEDPADRVFGTAATVAHCVAKDVSIVRVHDVDAMMDVVKVINAIR